MAARSEDASTRVRVYRAGALLVTAAAVAAVLIALFTSGSTSQLAPGKPVPGAAHTLALLDGIPQNGVALGNPAAPLTMVEFGDLQCPSCAIFAQEALPSIVARYVRSGRLLLVFRALEFIGGDSRRAAQMAGAMAEQDRLWQFIELMYANQGLENTSYVTDTYLKALAAAIPGVNVQRALAARGSAAVDSQLAEAAALARRNSVKSTPSFLLYASGQPPRSFSPAGLDAGSFEGALNRLLAGR